MYFMSNLCSHLYGIIKFYSNLYTQYMHTTQVAYSFIFTFFWFCFCQLLNVLFVQDQLRDKFEYSSGSKLWVGEVGAQLHGNVGNRSLLYAVKQVFPNVILNPKQQGYVMSVALIVYCSFLLYLLLMI